MKTNKKVGAMLELASLRLTVLTRDHPGPCTCPLCLAFSHVQLAMHFSKGASPHEHQEEVAPHYVASGQRQIRA